METLTNYIGIQDLNFFCVFYLYSYQNNSCWRGIGPMRPGPVLPGERVDWPGLHTQGQFVLCKA